MSATPAPANQYPELYPPFIWTSLLLAIFGGFAFAAHISATLGFGFSPGSSFLAILQAHGHLQLFGWVGFLLMGVSLYVLPRIARSTQSAAATIRTIYWLALSGVLLRTIAPLPSGYLSAETGRLLYGIALLGALLEAGSIFLYLRFMISGVRRGSPDPSDVSRLGPYFLPMFLGWSIFALAGVLQMAGIVFSRSLEWRYFFGFLQQEAFIRLVLVPAILGFGIKMLPGFLGLRVPLWPVRKVGILFCSSSFSFVFCRCMMVFGVNTGVFILLEALATVLLSASLLWYVWELDALLFRIPAERTSLKLFRSNAEGARGRFGDRGEFGRFELFIICGFAWLVVVAALEVTNAIFFQIYGYSLISDLILRHMLLLGFAAHLILGVSHRLLPGLLRRRLLRPKLTSVSFALLFSAALCRTVAPLLIHFGLHLPPHFYGLSGVLGWFALIVFALNLRLGRPVAAP